MKNHLVYKKFKRIAFENNYTIEQVENLDFREAMTLLGASFSFTFLKNMKRGIIDSLRNRDDNANLQQLKQVAKNWLDTNFPDWEAERGRQGEKPYITIWLKGKP